jgi:hypothetical protein
MESPAAAFQRLALAYLDASPDVFKHVYDAEGVFELRKRLSPFIPRNRGRQSEVRIK